MTFPGLKITFFSTFSPDRSQKNNKLHNRLKHKLKISPNDAASFCSIQKSSTAGRTQRTSQPNNIRHHESLVTGFPKQNLKRCILWAERPRDRECATARKERFVCVSMWDAFSFLLRTDCTKLSALFLSLSVFFSLRHTSFPLTLSSLSHPTLSFPPHCFYTNRKSLRYVLLNTDKHSTDGLISVTIFKLK